MPRKSPFFIKLTRSERAELVSRSGKYQSAYRDVIRAKIVLLASKGLANDAIGARLDTPRQIVSKWRQRFYTHRLSGLEDHPRDQIAMLTRLFLHKRPCPRGSVRRDRRAAGGGGILRGADAPPDHGRYLPIAFRFQSSQARASASPPGILSLAAPSSSEM
jgi:Homeodomain-like domain